MWHERGMQTWAPLNPERRRTDDPAASPPGRSRFSARRSALARSQRHDAPRDEKLGGRDAESAAGAAAEEECTDRELGEQLGDACPPAERKPENHGEHLSV